MFPVRYLLLISVVLFVPGIPVEAVEKKNVLFIMVDDLRAFELLPDVKKPHIDALAARGKSFSRAYCQIAVCNPSRQSLMTGMRPDTIRVWDLKQHFRDSLPHAITLPQLFKKNGYTTRSIGKIYHGSGRASKDPQSWSEEPLYDVALVPEQRYASPENLVGRTGLKRSSYEAADVPDARYIDGMVCDEAIDNLERYSNQDTPFFLAVGFRKPHLPFNAPQKYWDLYDPELLPEPSSDTFPEGAPELALRSWLELEGYPDIPKDRDLSDEMVSTLRHGYYACVSYIDAQVGKLTEKLRELDLEKNTVICLVSDHGFHLGEQGLWTKANNFELSARVPLIMIDPGMDVKGVVEDGFVELIDIYPSIAGACGLEVPGDVEGRDILADSESRDSNGYAVTQWPRNRKGNRHKGQGDIMGYSIVTADGRYTEWQDLKSQDMVASEFYDHSIDPHETRNRVDDISRAVSVGYLRSLMDKFRGYSASNRSRQKPHNVLFLAVDDMKDWINCLGGYEGKVHTPHIDRLAARGVLFEKAYCPSPKCAPSRAAVMTGLMASQSGLYDNGHWWYPNSPAGVVSIPKWFQMMGFDVQGAGKIFHHTAGNHPPNQWDRFQKLLFTDDPWFRGSKLNYPWSNPVPFPESYPFSGVRGLGHENDWGSIPLNEKDYEDSKSTDFTVEFLRMHRENPFFLACGLFRPHLPWYVPAKYFELYPLEDVVLPSIMEDDLDDIPSEGKRLARARQSDLNRIQKSGSHREAVQAYLASISYADAQIGRILDALDASPHASNTIVVLWSDHGWHLGEKSHWHKSTLWEESTRVPFMLAGPGIQPGICSIPVSLVDIFPTLREFSMAPVIRNIQKPVVHNPGELPDFSGSTSQSLGQYLDDPTNPSAWHFTPKPVVMEYLKGNAAVRYQHYRFIRYRDGGEEFYDHSNDPNEWSNAIDLNQYQMTIQTMRKALPTIWANSKPTKNAFVFNPENFSWEVKSSGKRISGKTSGK